MGHFDISERLERFYSSMPFVLKTVNEESKTFDRYLASIIMQEPNQCEFFNLRNVMLLIVSHRMMPDNGQMT